MKIDRKITGEIQSPEIGKVTVWLKMEGKSFDFFELDMKAKEVDSQLKFSTKNLLGKDVRYYEDYVQLLSNLGLKIDNLYRKHWEPSEKRVYSFIDTLRNKITVLESQVIQTSKVYFKTKEQAEVYNMKKNYRSL